VTSTQLLRRRAAAERHRVALPWAPQAGPERARRALNLVIAGAGLLLMTPVLLAIAALIKLTCGGPVFYKQTRIGLDRRVRGDRQGGDRRRRVDHGGQPFTIYKLCSMDPSRSQPDVQVWATPEDPRITPIGRVLRTYRLDELPQLWNVLRGDMNVVGPRPEQPQIFAHLRTQIEHYADRQRVRPGITGWAQINHCYDRSVGDVRRKVAYDLEYLARHSVLEDLKIMVRTVPVVVFKRGAW